jgi:hypothetical protein
MVGKPGKSRQLAHRENSAQLSPLPGLAHQINAAHEACIQAAQDAVEKAIEVGRLLIEAKAKVQHGEWAEWVAGNCSFGLRQCQNYMRVFMQREVIDEQKRNGVSHLTSMREAVAALAEPKLQTWPEVLNDLASRAPGFYAYSEHKDEPDCMEKLRQSNLEFEAYCKEAKEIYDAIKDEFSPDLHEITDLKYLMEMNRCLVRLENKFGESNVRCAYEMGLILREIDAERNPISPIGS